MEKIWLKSYPPGVPHDVNPEQYRSVAHLLEESFRKHAKSPFSVCMDRWMNYSELERLSGALGAYLQGLGLQPGARVAIMLPNIPQFGVTMAAVLHAQTEELDQDMGRAWLAQEEGADAAHDAARYTAAWRTVGQRHARQQQLERVLAMGTDLARLTRTPGLRMMLRMMRGPANAAGMGALQKFLEAGFDTFGQLARQRGGVEQFLATIEQRERALMDLLFDADPVTCGTQLNHTLGQAR